MTTNRSKSDAIKKARPLSPHLQIYKPQISSTLSILHRLMGLALVVGVVPLVWWLGALAAGPNAYQDFLRLWSSGFGLVLLFGWTLAFFYHLLNGIRHLAWDAGYGFSLPALRQSGWLVVILTLGLSAMTWAFILF